MATRQPRFDASSATPLYEQVADYMEAQIMAVTWRPRMAAGSEQAWKEHP